MYTVTFPNVAGAILQIFLMALAGFILVKKRFIDESGLKMLAKLLISFFWPCYVFYHLSQEFRFTDYPRWWMFPLLSLGITFFGLIIGQAMLRLFFARIKQRKEFTTLVTFQNSGFLPLMLAATIFGPVEAQRVTIYILIFLVGFDLTVWSLGVWLLRGPKKRAFDFKTLLNPPLLAIGLTLILVALGLERFLPAVVIKPVKVFSDCALPTALLIVGGNLAALKIVNVSRRAVWGAVFSKLVLMPLLAIALVQLFHAEFWVGFLIVLQAVVPSAITLSILARHTEGIDEHFINQGLFLSHGFCLLTIPVFLSMYFHLRSP